MDLEEAKGLYFQLGAELGFFGEKGPVAEPEQAAPVAARVTNQKKLYDRYLAGDPELVELVGFMDGSGYPIDWYYSEIGVPNPDPERRHPGGRVGPLGAIYKMWTSSDGKSLTRAFITAMRVANVRPGDIHEAHVNGFFSEMRS